MKVFESVITEKTRREVEKTRILKCLTYFVVFLLIYLLYFESVFSNTFSLMKMIFYILLVLLILIILSYRTANKKKYQMISHSNNLLKNFHLQFLPNQNQLFFTQTRYKQNNVGNNTNKTIGNFHNENVQIDLIPFNSLNQTFFTQNTSFTFQSATQNDNQQF